MGPLSSAPHGSLRSSDSCPVLSHPHVLHLSGSSLLHCDRSCLQVCLPAIRLLTYPDTWHVLGKAFCCIQNSSLIPINSHNSTSFLEGWPHGYVPFLQTHSLTTCDSTANSSQAKHRGLCVPQGAESRWMINHIQCATLPSTLGVK